MYLPCFYLRIRLSMSKHTAPSYLFTVLFNSHFYYFVKLNLFLNSGRVHDLHHFYRKLVHSFLTCLFFYLKHIPVPFSFVVEVALILVDFLTFWFDLWIVLVNLYYPLMSLRMSFCLVLRCKYSYFLLVYSLPVNFGRML